MIDDGPCWRARRRRQRRPDDECGSRQLTIILTQLGSGARKLGQLGPRRLGRRWPSCFGGANRRSRSRGGRSGGDRGGGGSGRSFGRSSSSSSSSRRGSSSRSGARPSETCTAPDPMRLIAFRCLHWLERSLRNRRARASLLAGRQMASAPLSQLQWTLQWRLHWHWRRRARWPAECVLLLLRLPARACSAGRVAGGHASRAAVERTKQQQRQQTINHPRWSD